MYCNLSSLLRSLMKGFNTQQRSRGFQLEKSVFLIPFVWGSCRWCHQDHLLSLSEILSLDPVEKASQWVLPMPYWSQPRLEPPRAQKMAFLVWRWWFPWLPWFVYPQQQFHQELLKDKKNKNLKLLNKWTMINVYFGISEFMPQKA